MASNYNTKLPYKSKYPGDGYYYVLCDICGKKMRAKDTVLIKDKYNYHNNLLVCPEDADETNPQTYIRAAKEKQINNPKIIRSEGTDQFVFISSTSEIENGDSNNPAGRNPGVPKYLISIGATSSQIELQWIGPDDSGSSAICGYKIERESPIGGGFSTLVSDTQSVATYYKDTSVSSSTQYNYRVSAINRNGTGSASNEADNTTG